MKLKISGQSNWYTIYVINVPKGCCLSPDENGQVKTIHVLAELNVVGPSFLLSYNLLSYISQTLFSLSEF